MTTFHPETPKNCPPKDAVSPNGIFFRFVFNNPPIPDDFVVWVDEPENKHYLDDKKKQGNCGAFAMSMLVKEGITRLRGLFQHPLKKKAIQRNSFFGLAQVKLDSNSGKIKQTGQNPHHYDLWPYLNSKLERNVISVEEILK